jgi:hypothetical protein
MKFIYAILIFLTFTICNAQNDKLYRETFKLNLAVNEEQYYTMDVAKTPYFVKEKILQIYPGENVFIETEVKGDSIFSMKTVERNIHPERTIEIKFYQEAGDKTKISMFLNVKNPFDRTLNHDAMMYTVKRAQWQKTSIIPIRAKLQNFETWGYPIITLALSNWRFE